MRAIVVAVLLVTPALASAGEPSLSAEVAVGASDLTIDALPGVQPRLTFRLDGDEAVSVFARAGFTFREDGHAIDGAVGPDGRICNASGWCAGLRLALGLHRAEYTEASFFAPGDDVSVTSTFLEVMPYVTYDRLTLGLEAALHRIQSGAPDDKDELFGRAGVTAAIRF